MKPLILVFFWAAVAAVWLRCNNTKPLTSAHAVKETFATHLAGFDSATAALANAISHQPSTTWVAAFEAARRAYKRLEVFADYYFPGTAKAINGPPVTEVEADDPAKQVAPTGFQVMEPALYPQPDSLQQTLLRQQAGVLQSAARRLRNGLETLQLTDGHVFDALRLHLLRTVAIGLSGADNGVSQQGLAEAAAGLQSLADYAAPYHPPLAFKRTIKAAVAELSAGRFTHYNRGGFVLQVARPLWAQLHHLQRQRGIAFVAEGGVVRTAAPVLFDSAFFNPEGFAQRPATANPALARLGEKLFFDNHLSGNGSRHCGTCHRPEKAYTDGLPRNRSFDGQTVLLRNTPTIRYAGLQLLQFADGRLAFLEDQAKAVIENHHEMRGSVAAVARQVAKDKGYTKLVQAAFGRTEVKPEDIGAALAAFVRQQSPFNAPFDRYLRGQADALSPQALHGFNLFMGKAKCGTCHFFPLFNGVVPPHFSRMESEVIGVPATARPPYRLDEDEGRFRASGVDLHRHSFKTPTVRNAARTAPFMHNGVFNTLEEVVEFYNRGGGQGLGLLVPNQTLPPDPLHLTAAEKAAVIAFLHALTDR